MKINEVLDSTESWATLKGVSLEKYNELEAGYRQQLEILKTTVEVANILNPEQYNAVLTATKDQTSIFTQDADEYANDLKNLGINNDTDLNNKIAAVENMRSEISKLASKL